jgi:uncharacterized protein HemX
MGSFTRMMPVMIAVAAGALIVGEGLMILHLQEQVGEAKAEARQFETAAVNCAAGTRKLMLEAEAKKRAFAESLRRLREAQVRSASQASSILSDRERPGESQCAYVERHLNEEIDLRNPR